MRGMILVLVNVLLSMALLSCAARTQPIRWEETQQSQGVLIWAAGAANSCPKSDGYTVDLRPSGGGVLQHGC
jgi:hypothetical protein